jgi:hypothetical protein
MRGRAGGPRGSLSGFPEPEVGPIRHCGWSARYRALAGGLAYPQRAGARLEEASRTEALFTGVRGREILRSPYAGCRIAPLASHPTVGPRLLGSSRSTTTLRTCASLCARAHARHPSGRRHGGGGSRSSWGRSDRGSPVVQDSMRTEVGLSRRLVHWVLRAVDSSFVSFKGIQGAFAELWISRAGSVEELGILQRPGQGRVERSRGLEDPNLALSSPTDVQPAPTSPKLGYGVFSEVGLPVYGVLRTSL